VDPDAKHDLGVALGALIAQARAMTLLLNVIAILILTIAAGVGWLIFQPARPEEPGQFRFVQSSAGLLRGNIKTGQLEHYNNRTREWEPVTGKSGSLYDQFNGR
jgi:hypothetical protein